MAKQSNNILPPEPMKLDEIQIPDLTDPSGPATKPGAIDLPLPNAGEMPLSTAESRKGALDQWLNKSTNAASSPLMRTKATPFGAGMDHHQFERYYNMPRVYNKLGFSPFRDNEAAYNKESNFFDELGRASGQWATLTGLGFKDALTFGSLQDSAMAEKYEKAMGIGSSSKGGVSGFVNNLYLNSGYTMGILSEVMLEEVGLALITAGTGFGASEITVPTMIARGLRAGNKIYEGARLAQNVIRTVDNLGDVNKARKFFNQTLKNGGRFLNPLENTVDFMQGIDHARAAHLAETGTNMTKLAETSLGFGNFYKDIRNIRYAWGESGLEGGMEKNRMEKELLEEHYRLHDRPPTKEESMAIKETALKAGATTGWQNVGAIYFSNKIVLDGLFKGWAPMKNLTADALDGGSNGMFKLFKERTAKGDSPWEVVEDNMKQKFREFKDPTKSVAVGLNYFKANIAEGLQESMQETISGAAHDFYKEEWKGDTVKGGYYSSILDNLHKQTTAEGLEVFMSGFLMGGMISPMATTMGSFVPGSKQQSYLKNKWKQFRDQEGYNKMKEQKREEINKKANMLNELWDQVGDRLAPDLENLVAQERYVNGMAEAEQAGDAKAFYDFKDESQYKHIYNALRTGKFDTFIDRLEDLKQLQPEDTQWDFKMSKEEFDAAIDKTVARAKQIEARYEAAQTQFKNPFPARSADEDKQDPRHVAWQRAQEKFVFLQYSFDRALKRTESIMNSAQQDSKLANVPVTDFTTMFSLKTMDDEITRLEIEEKAMEGVKGKEATQLRKDIQRKKKLLEDFSNKMEILKVQKTEEGNIDKLDMKDKEVRKKLNIAKTAYKRYLRYLAEVNGNYAFNDALDESFEKMVDAYMLQAETSEMHDAINKMLDPTRFQAVAARELQIMKLRAEGAKQERKDSLKAYYKAFEANKLLEGIYEVGMLEGIYKLGMFFDHKQFEDIIRDGTMPEKFQLYYVDEGPNGDHAPVVENSEDYTAAVNVITEFVPGIMGIPLSQAEVNRAKDAYNNEARTKFENDKRTYRDLATQYGFNPKAVETTVPLKRVLTAVSNSEYATDSEKTLARQLLRRVTEGETVTFSNNEANPGSYSPTTQTVIDARYSSNEYEGAVLPIEFVILHEEIHRRTVTELDTDQEFNREITAIYDAVRQHFKETAAKEELEPYGMANIQEFVAEAMTNSTFQEVLANVPYKVTGKSAWAGFVDSVMNMLKKIFKGKKATGTALNEALHVITTKIDETYGIKDGAVVTEKPTKPTVTSRKKKPEVVRTPENTKVTKAMKVPTLVKKHPELAAEILEEYKRFNAERAEGPLDPGLKDKDATEIYDSVLFQNYYKGPYESVQNILDVYNDRTGRDVEPLIKAASSRNKGTAVISRLKELGYDDAEIKAMKTDDAVTLANENISKAQREEEAALAEAAAAKEDVEKREEMRNAINILLTNATTLDQMKLAEEAITNMLEGPAYIENPNGPNGWAITELKGEEVQALIDGRMKDIAFTVKPEDIVPGTVITLKSGAEMVVDRITDKGTILAHHPKDITKVSEFDIEKIKFASNVSLQEALKEDITDNDEELSDETQQTANDNAGDKADEAAKKAREEGDSDWLDGLNKC
jgi:hypothetical protein